MTGKAAHLLKTVLTVLVILLLSACPQIERAEEPREPPAAERPEEAPPPMAAPEPPPTRGDELGISRHAWDLLTHMDAEEQGFGMYTYVLFARRVDRSGLAADVEQRYEKILEAITGTTLGLPELGEMTSRQKEETNLLYVPALAPGRELRLANYNSPLALRYLAEIARLCRDDNPQIAERLEQRPGPFLITLSQPLGQIGAAPVNLLYADLSSTHTAAINEVVTAYKARLTREPVAEIERFVSLRTALLNLVLNADANLRLVKVALAEWVPQ